MSIRKPRRDVPCFDLEGLEPRLQCDAALAAAVKPGKPVSNPIKAAGIKLPDLKPLANRNKGYIHGWITDTQKIPGHTLLRLTTAMANMGLGPMEITSKGVLHADHSRDVYQRIYTASGKHYDRYAGTLRWHATHQHFHFDNFAVYRLREYGADGAVGAIVATGDKASFCLTDVDPFNTRLPGLPADGAYDSCSFHRQGISVGWADVYTQSLDDQWIDVSNVPAGKYWLEVEVDPNNRIQESNETNNITRIAINFVPPPPPPPAPVNDNYADATVLTGQSASVTGTNAGATSESGEPSILNYTADASAWWVWTAPADGKVTIDTLGSDFDTMLGVYTGDTIFQIKTIAQNDDANHRQTSEVTFDATAGTTYHIKVAGYRAATGNAKLNLSEV